MSEAEANQRLAAALAVLPRERTYLLPALHAAQDLLGYLPEWALAQVGEHVRVPPSDLYGVASHYPEFRLRAPGRHVLRLCTGVPCLARGANEVLTAVCAALGVRPGETTADGRFTVEEIDCCFVCGVAPVAELDHAYVGRLTPESAVELTRRPEVAH